MGRGTGTDGPEATVEEPTEESTTAEEPTEEESGPEVSPTSFETMWIDDSWTLEAIEFDSPTAPQQVDPLEGDPMPLLVTLPDDVTCTTISHDHDQHWDGMYSWYRCDDGSELLTSEDIADTFERGETWTVQRSMDKGEPESTAVLSAVYAGR